MNPTLTLSGMTGWFSGLLCRLREARRLRRARAELATMGAHELRDLGISHASIAAAARRESCCA